MRKPCEKWQSKDKTFNKQEKKLTTLMKERGRNIINDNTIDEQNGGFTYRGSRECSVIDYVTVNAGAIKVKKMKIEKRVETEHVLVVIRFSLGFDLVTQKKYKFFLLTITL